MLKIKNPAELEGRGLFYPLALVSVANSIMIYWNLKMFTFLSKTIGKQIRTKVGNTVRVVCFQRGWFHIEASDSVLLIQCGKKKSIVGKEKGILEGRRRCTRSIRKQQEPIISCVCTYTISKMKSMICIVLVLPTWRKLWPSDYYHLPFFVIKHLRKESPIMLKIWIAFCNRGLQIGFPVVFAVSIFDDAPYFGNDRVTQE